MPGTGSIIGAIANREEEGEIEDGGKSLPTRKQPPDYTRERAK
jgi:hypothetical protein